MHAGALTVLDPFDEDDQHHALGITITFDDQTQKILRWDKAAKEFR